MKLDIGCGPNKKDGFLGVDKYAFDGKVDVVLDVCAMRKALRPVGPAQPYDAGVALQHNAYVDEFVPWPWEDDSVEEVHCSHFLEHLTQEERCWFMNELHRVLKKDGKATIIVPHWASNRAYVLAPTQAHKRASTSTQAGC